MVEWGRKCNIFYPFQVVINITYHIKSSEKFVCKDVYLICLTQCFPNLVDLHNSLSLLYLLKSQGVSVPYTFWEMLDYGISQDIGVTSSRRGFSRQRGIKINTQEEDRSQKDIKYQRSIIIINFSTFSSFLGFWYFRVLNKYLNDFFFYLYSSKYNHSCLAICNIHR